MVFRVYPETPRLKFVPGQYTALGLSQTLPRVDEAGRILAVSEEVLIKRPFSISSSILGDHGELLEPMTLEYYEFYAEMVSADERIKPRFSPRLFTLKDDDRIYLGPKIVGHYTLEARQSGKHLLFVATTTGEAPHNAMIGECLRGDDAGSIAHMVIGQDGWVSAYAKKHETLTQKFSRYRYLSLEDDSDYNCTESFLGGCLSDGSVSKKHIGWAITADNTHVFLCGDPRMIGAPVKLGAWKYEHPNYGLGRLFAQRGFNWSTRFRHGNLSYEAYW